MNKFRAISASLVLAVACSLFGAVNPAFAATSSGNGMRVSPVRTDVVIQPGGSKTVSVFVQNVTNGDETLRVIVNDFVSKDETGSPSLLLNGEANAKHGLKQYLTVPKTVFIPAGQQKEVPVVVAIPKDAAGGGYYGAVRFAPGSSSDDSNKNVSLTGSVGSLILVNVPGNVTENLQIASFDARKNDKPSKLFTSGSGIAATVRFRNSGNVQEAPFGKILLKKGGKVLSTYEINNTDPRGNVLPDSIRKFNVKLTNVGSFGKYTLQGNFGYSTSGQLLSATTTFYVVPLAAIIAVGVLIALIVLAIVLVPRSMKRYNQRVLRRAGRR